MLNTNRNWIIWWKVWKSFSKTEIFLLALEPGARWRQNPNSRQRQWNRLKFGTLNNYHMASKMLNLKIKKVLLALCAGANWRQSWKNISYCQSNCFKLTDIEYSNVKYRSTNSKSNFIFWLGTDAKWRQNKNTRNWQLNSLNIAPISNWHM